MRYPCELGPHLTMFLLIYRYIANVSIVVYSLPKVIEDGNCPWLSELLGWTIFGAALVLSVVGFAIHVAFMNPEFYITRLWKRQTGKMYSREMWLSTDIYKSAFYTKDEERAGLVIRFHPNYLPKDIVETWVCTIC